MYYFYTQFGDSALTLAASGGHTDVVVELVKGGASLDLQNKVFTTATHTSLTLCMSTYSNVMSLLFLHTVWGLGTDSSGQWWSH